MGGLSQHKTPDNMSGVLGGEDVRGESATHRYSLITAAAATTVAHGFTRLSFVDVELTAHELLTVQSVDGFLASFSGSHFDETETTGAASFAIGYNADALHVAILSEVITQGLLVGVEREVANINVHVNIKRL
jgi:hypothetical protein